MKTSTELNEAKLQQVATILNTLLADEYVLYLKTRNADWNIHRQNFSGLHKFFQSQYQSLEKSIDRISEQVRKIGYYPMSSLSEFLSITSMFEDAEPENINAVFKMIISEHENMITIVQKEFDEIPEAIDDPDLSALYFEIIDKHKKIIRLLKSKFATGVFNTVKPGGFGLPANGELPLMG
jgi:starvation-inducible DNA-binding protein